MKPICLPMIEPVHLPDSFGLGAHSHTRAGAHWWDDYTPAGMGHVTAHAAAHASA